MTRALVLLVALLVALGACSSEPDTPPRTADQVVADLAGRVPSASPTVVFTAETDPNALLGRPGGYTSAAGFSDARVPSEYRDALAGSVEAGGKVEVFADEDAAQRRADYIGSISEQAPMFSEWTFVSGATVVRVSRFLTEPQANEYRAVLGA